MKINLVVFNHISPDTNDTRGVHDHILVLQKFFKEIEISLTVSNILNPHALNIVIENFNESSVKVIDNFCKKYEKKVCVIMTEHLSLEGNDLKYGTYKITDREYIGNVDQRIFSLFALSENTMAYFTLGELPFLSDIKKILFTDEVYRINYPKIKPCNDVDFTKAEFDLGFTGAIIPYREKIINKLKEEHKVFTSGIVSSEEERLKNTRKSKAIISIPQNEEWKWISPMRFMYNLEVGMPSIHYGEGDDTEFYKKILSWVTVDEVLKNPKEVYDKQIKAYNDLDLHSNKFLNFLNIWNMMETD